MRRYWIILAIAAALLALVFWPRDQDSQHEARKPATMTEEAAKGRTGGTSMPSSHTQATPLEVPRLSDDTPAVILDARPKLPYEPWDVYHARLRLVEHWNACRQSLNLSKEQERALLFALYDNQQNRTEVMRGDYWRDEDSDFLFALREAHDALMRKIERILTGDQWGQWRVSTDCAVLPVWASDGALRLPGDSPDKLYGEFAMELD